MQLRIEKIRVKMEVKQKGRCEIALQFPVLFLASMATYRVVSNCEQPVFISFCGFCRWCGGDALLLGFIGSGSYVARVMELRLMEMIFFVKDGSLRWEDEYSVNMKELDRVELG